MGILNGLFGRELGTGWETRVEMRERPDWSTIMMIHEWLYPGQTEPSHIDTLVSSSLGGVNSLEGIPVYCTDEPRPHWRYIVYGLADVYGKQGGPGDSGIPGYDLGLTFRFADDKALKVKELPTWPLSLSRNPTRYTSHTDNGLAPNQQIDANGPVVPGKETIQITLGSIEDPDLGGTETPSGSVQSVQPVGLTAEDLNDVSNWNAEKFFSPLVSSRLKSVTELRGTSLWTDPETVTRITESRKRDGSQIGQAFIDMFRTTSEGDMPMLTIRIHVAGVLRERLNGRLPHGREFLFHSPDAELLLLSGGRTGIQLGAEEATLTLSPTDLSRLVATLRVKVGQYMAPDGVIWSVERVEITDNDRNVVETAG